MTDDHHEPLETVHDPTLENVERECWYDAPMKMQVTDDLETEVQA